MKLSNTDKLIYVVLAFTLGVFGVHDFAYGKTSHGVIKIILSILFFWICCFPTFVWCVVDVIKMLRSNNIYENND